MSTTGTSEFSNSQNRGQASGEAVSFPSKTAETHVDELAAIILAEEERDPYRRCTTGIDGCYLAPKTDPSQRVDGRALEHTVAQCTVGRTNFRLQDGTPWGYERSKRLKGIDDGNANLTYGGETTTGPYRVNDREVYTSRRAESVACQVGLTAWHKMEVKRLIAESDLRPWNWLGGVDAAIVGAIAYAYRGDRRVVSRSGGFAPRRLIDGPEEALKHPAVQDAIDMLCVEGLAEVVSFAFDRFE